MSGFPWRTALFISLAFNLILVSVAVGAYVAGARIERPRPAQAQGETFRAPGARAFMLALPPEARRVLRERLAQNAEAMRAERETAVAARLHVYEVAGQEPYNAEAVKQAFAAMRAADAALASHFHNDVADALTGLTPEQRQAALQAARAFAGPGAVGRGEPAMDRADAPDRPSAERRRERRERMRERWRQRNGEAPPPPPPPPN